MTIQMKKKKKPISHKYLKAKYPSAIHPMKRNTEMKKLWGRTYVTNHVAHSHGKLPAG